jgi:hypothetical protein
MAKYNFKEKGKLAMMTAAEVGTVGVSMLVTKKFLDFNTLFKNQIAKDPTYADKWFIKHQGAIKFGAGIIAAIHVDNPWLRLAFIGVAVVGFIEETRVLTTDKDTGESFFDKIGKGKGNYRVSDEELYQAAMMGQDNPTDKYPTFVGAENPTTEYPTTVGAGWEMQNELMPKSTTSVGQW